MKPVSAKSLAYVSKEMSSVGRQTSQVTSFACAVIRNPYRESEHFNKYLAVEEAKGRGWWTVGGAVDSGESFEVAAMREAKEEANLEIELKGILRFMHLVG